MHTRQSKHVTYSRAFIEWVLAAFSADPAAALLDTPVVKLIKAGPFVPTVTSTKADFAAAIANFTDFASKALVPLSPRSIGAVGRAAIDTVEWAMTTDPVVTGNAIKGYWVEDADRVVSYELFQDDEQVTMVEVGDSLVLEVILPLPYLVDLEPVG